MIRLTSVARVLVPILCALALAGTPRDALAACAFGTPSGGERSLQQVVDGLFGTGQLDVAADCLAEGTDGLYRIRDATAAATVLIELAGFSDRNQFGIYDSADPSRRLMLFDGPNDAGTKASLSIAPVGASYLVTVLIGVTERSATFASADFGFYLRTPQTGPNGEQRTYFTQTPLNPDGFDHFHAYAGGGQKFIGGPLYVPDGPAAFFSSDSVLIAAEDLFGGGDRDYQDFVMIASGISVVPLPAAAWLLGGGLFALAGFVRRRGSSPQAGPAGRTA